MWTHYRRAVKQRLSKNMQNICKKDRLTKFKNWENSNDPNQDKIVVELRKKLRLSETRLEEMEAKLIELRKANAIAKQSIAEYQARKSN